MYAVFIYNLVLQLVFAMALLSIIDGKPMPSKNALIIASVIAAMQVIFAATYAPHLVSLQQVAAMLGVLFLAYISAKLHQL